MRMTSQSFETVKERLSPVNEWLFIQFDMDLRKASHILGIKLMRDYQKWMLGLSQVTYINKVLARISMHNFKKGFVPLRLGKILSLNQRFKTHAEIEIGRAHV